MREHPYVVLDVFTDTPLEGNPLAVFTAGDTVPAELMQRAARELNLSETVFVLPGEAGVDARVRIFTPMVELPFAGHPVLGAAFVVGERDGADTVRLLTGSGLVEVVVRRQGGRIVEGEMIQPIPTVAPFASARALLRALGVERAELPVEVYDNGPRHVMVMLDTEASVADLTPDLNAVRDLGEIGVSCFAVTGTRVKTRMFGPALGVSEDPATGSAAGPLAVHLARHGRIGFGQRIEIVQGGAIGRPSLLRAQVTGTPERIDSVRVGGAAVQVARGAFRLS